LQRVKSRTFLIATLVLAFAGQGCIIHTTPQKSTPKSSAFRQMNFQDLIERYMQKQGANSIEGVYAVSGMVIKKSKNLLGEMREKTTDRKDNYATVAILKESEDSNDYIELSLNKEGQASYSIIGEFNPASGNLLLYNHFDAKGKDTRFTFTQDEKAELLEGIRVDDEGGKQITYKLTYVKLKAR
jgi:hypothetical protein